jgi:hypothetical protein
MQHMMAEMALALLRRLDTISSEPAAIVITPSAAFCAGISIRKSGPVKTYCSSIPASKQTVIDGNRVMRCSVEAAA